MLAFLNLIQVTTKHKGCCTSQFETTEQYTTRCRCQPECASQLFSLPNPVQLKYFMKDHPCKISRN